MLGGALFLLNAALTFQNVWPTPLGHDAPRAFDRARGAAARAGGLRGARAAAGSRGLGRAYGVVVGDDGRPLRGGDCPRAVRTARESLLGLAESAERRCDARQGRADLARGRRRRRADCAVHRRRCGALVGARPRGRRAARPPDAPGVGPARGRRRHAVHREPRCELAGSILVLAARCKDLLAAVRIHATTRVRARRRTICRSHRSRLRICNVSAAPTCC